MWRQSNSGSFFDRLLGQAVDRQRRPGHQVNQWEFTGALQAHGIQIGIHGKGRWRDYVFVERVWEWIKYEEIYLHACKGVSDARAGIGKYFSIYNRRRPHSEHGGEAAATMYFDNLEQKKAA